MKRRGKSTDCLLVPEKHHHIEQTWRHRLAGEGNTCRIHQHAGFDPQFVRQTTHRGLGRFMVELRKRREPIPERSQIAAHVLVLQEFFDGGRIEFDFVRQKDP